MSIINVTRRAVTVKVIINVCHNNLRPRPHTWTGQPFLASNTLHRTVFFVCVRYSLVVRQSSVLKLNSISNNSL